MTETHLARLPPIVAGSACCSLPLSESAAWALVDVVLATSPDDCGERLAESLGHDAPLVLWAVCAAGAGEDRPLRTLHEVARWIRGEGRTHVLQWTGELLGGQAAIAPSTLARWIQLANASTRAVHQVWRQGALRDDQATLLALLHNAPQWLAASIDPPLDQTLPSSHTMSHSLDSTAGTISCLPHWLADQLNRLDQQPPPEGPARQVARALQRCDQEEHEAASRDAGGLAERESSSWWPGGHVLACVFPQLLQRLRQATALENDFAERLEQEKLLAMKELAYGAGHEINNPLANISSRAQTLLRQETDADRRRKLATINAQAFRAHEMIADMMLFANLPPLARQNINVATLLDAVIDQLKPMAEAQDTRIERAKVDGLPEMDADPIQMQVALTAICSNSLEAIGLGGQIRIEAATGTDHDQEFVVIRIRDTGPGISPEVRHHLFDPFYSGREAGRGLGFGLAKAWRIITAHGGHISVESEMGVGATLAAHLPLKAADNTER